MKALAASLLIAMTPVVDAEPINIDDMIEAIRQIEGGKWGELGGTCCISEIAWRQHRPDLAYQLSGDRDFATPIYREHLHWLAYNLARNGLKVTPATLYTCWRRGLKGGVKILRRGPVPAQATRCQNLYESLNSSPAAPRKQARRRPKATAKRA